MPQINEKSWILYATYFLITMMMTLIYFNFNFKIKTYKKKSYSKKIFKMMI